MAAQPALQLALLLRSERYRRLDATPSIRLRTDFFAAAATVTRMLAYGGATPFLGALSEALETFNLARAGQIERGLIYPSGSVESNTVDFVHHEQCIVQEALERLRLSSPRNYAAQIASANAAITFAWRARAACSAGTWAIFTRAAHRCRARLNRGIEFALQTDREALGVEIARGHRV